jgi:hypothetical protein
MSTFNLNLFVIFQSDPPTSPSLPFSFATPLHLDHVSDQLYEIEQERGSREKGSARRKNRGTVVFFLSTMLGFLSPNRHTYMPYKAWDSVNPLAAHNSHIWLALATAQKMISSFACLCWHCISLSADNSLPMNGRLSPSGCRRKALLQSHFIFPCC